MTKAQWPEDGLECVSACPLCNDESREILFEGLADEAFDVAPGVWDLWRCGCCGSAYLDPRPTRDTIGAAYGRYFTHDSVNHRFVRRIGRLRSLIHDAINGYQNRRFGLSLTPASPALSFFLPLIPSLRAGADTECRHLPRPARPGAKLLDVGCGNGGFLAQATQAGWIAEGIDFDVTAVEAARARGLKVWHCGIEGISHLAEEFDAVTLSHVVEHVFDPKELLLAVHRLLRPGGSVWIETPNIESFGVRAFGRAWRGLEPPRHLLLFNAMSLRNALRSAGFHGIQQKWRGMAVFDVFAASERIRANGVGLSGTYAGRPPLFAVAAELLEMVCPSRREFLTFVARK